MTMTKNRIYGYCRVSTQSQRIERQVSNITNAYPGAIIIQEKYTGTKIQGRKEFEKLLKALAPGDTLVFDSVSRMSRNAEEGVELYEDLLDKGINLVFLKEPYINTDTYKTQLADRIELTGSDEDILFHAINQYMKKLARKQVVIAFEQAEKEVQDLRKRTSEGMIQAKLKGARIGAEKGAKLTTKKSVMAKELIKKHSKDFYGTLKDTEVIKLTGINRNTYYKYKKELTIELNN